MRAIKTTALVATLAALAACAAASSAAVDLGASGSTRYAVVGNTAVRALGNSGWLEFCNRGSQAGAQADRSTPSSECVNVRLMEAAELDASGSVVAEGPGNSGRREVNLRTSLSLSAATRATLPRCVGVVGNNVNVCGANANGTALEYARIPITASLGGTGSLSLDAVIFTQAGYFTFDGRNVTVGAGTMKFDMSVNTYAFATSGRKLAVDVIVKDRSKSEGDVTVATNSSGWINVNGAALVNFPRYAVRTSLTASWEWRTASISATSKGANTVLRYEFEGPFIAMQYDPMAGGDSSGSDSAAAGASALLAFAAALIAAALAVVA